MALDKDFKRQVRQRMTETGERYTVARAALDERSNIDSERERDDLGELEQRWIELLGDQRQAMGAFELLKALPENRLRRAALAGVTSDDWRVRRYCCRLLDDTSLVDESLVALERALEDEHPDVRRAAMHSLTCQHCKPDGCALDVRGIFERMANDPNRKVREGVIGTLSWALEDDWAVEILERCAAGDPSRKLRELAAKGVDRIRRQLASDGERRQLPEPLRSKTERHPGKWVGVADGELVIAARMPGRVRRALRGTRATDKRAYWVKP